MFVSVTAMSLRLKSRAATSARSMRGVLTLSLCVAVLSYLDPGGLPRRPDDFASQPDRRPNGHPADSLDAPSLRNAGKG